MSQFRERGRDVAVRAARRAGVVGRSEVADLRRRIEALEAEVQENRRLNLRVAELLDVVQELLVPAAARDESRIQAVLDKYAQSL